MAAILNALTRAWLVIRWMMHEFPFCAWKVVSGCEVVERSGSGKVYSQLRIPLMFSLCAELPTAG